MGDFGIRVAMKIKKIVNEDRLTLTLKALLKPLAKKPPKGAMREEKQAKAKACHAMGYIQISLF